MPASPTGPRPTTAAPTAPAGRAVPRRRATLLLGVAVAVGLALQIVRARVPGADLAGTVLWTAAVACVVAIAVPRLGPGPTAAAATALGLAVELAQLTPVPAALSTAFPPARLVLGTSFAAADLAGYAIGGLVAWLVLRTLARA